MTEDPRDGRQHREVSRREVLRWAGAAALVGTLGPASLAACAITSSAGTPSADVDVAIIGGGPSGLYAAYRLLTGTPRSKSPVTSKPSVAIFEASDRLGATYSPSGGKCGATGNTGVSGSTGSTGNSG